MHARQNFDALTSLRFVAAFLVLISHVIPFWLPPGALPQGFSKVLVAGTIAVPFFFTLSGFVLFHADSRDGVGWFYWKRFCKIAPLFYLSLALHSLTYVSRATPAPLPAALAVNAAFLGAWIPKWLFLNPPGWTLSVEAFFYLLFPFLAPLARKIPVRAVGPLLALNFLAGMLLVHFGKAASLTLFDFLFSNPLAHLGEFISGILLARAYRTPNAPGFFIFAGAAGLVTLLLLVDVLGETPLRSYAGTPFFCALIWGACGIKSGPLTAGWLIALGNASYALYAIHWPLLEILRLAQVKFTAFTALGVLVVFPLLSLPLFRFFEVPVRAALLEIRRAPKR
jgi:peptidoglycan/LPS O-acetylase OafA/YrhL